MSRMVIFISNNISRLLLFLFLSLLGPICLQVVKPASCTSSSYTTLPAVTCLEKEGKALLSFKQNLTDPSARLSSWVGEDCCKWRGVHCDNQTGHVIKLDLRNHFQFTANYDYFDIIVDEEKEEEEEKEKAVYNRSCLGGEVSPSLLDLKHLSYLDLSLNNFNGNRIPKFLGSLESLRYLNLSYSFFAGVIPPHLGNLTRLQYLDLYASFPFSTPFDSRPNLKVESLQWLVGLSSLKYLNMGFVYLGNAPPADWLQAVNMLPSLLELHLHFCGLISLPQSISSINFTFLSILDLSGNIFNSYIPHWLSNVSSLTILNLQENSLLGVIPDTFANLVSLEELDLSNNYFIEGHLPAGLGRLNNLRKLDLTRNNITGKIPSSFSNLCNLQTINLTGNNIGGEIIEFVDGLSTCSNTRLESLILSQNKLLGGILPYSLGELRKLTTLDLSICSFWGSIPESIGNLSSLQSLNLLGNQMNGTIPESIGKLSMLVSLSLSVNSWQCVLTEAHFQNLVELQSLDFGLESSTNRTLILNINPNWLPPFKLTLLELDNMQIGPKFPTWVQTQNELEYLTLQNVEIDDTIPYGFWNSCSKIRRLDMSKNKLRGQVPYFQPHPVATSFDLSSNSLEGPLPLFASNLTVVYLDGNLFSGPIPENIGQLLPKLLQLDLSSNAISGRIPPSITMLKNLLVLLLKNNCLFGELPAHWEDMQSLSLLDVANNSISGTIPSTMGFLSSLSWLSLSKNNLEGELPSSLRNCTHLFSLDLGWNKLVGNLPAWIGENLPLLRLSLRSNLIDGNIPQQFCLLSNLRILDLANNNLSGGIPQCIGNLSKSGANNSDDREHMVVVSKGREYQYEATLRFVYSLDLSKNNLSGEIPDNITSLLGLVILNLSMNHLSGKIPKKIGNLHSLESLDLSRNELSGPIPQTLSSLNFLSYLNLSFNNLSGKIPSGNQLQTLNDYPSIYGGNPLLCGPPPFTKCPGDEADQGPTPNGGNRKDNNDGKGIESLSFYISMTAGFIIGFWGVCGTLIIKASWRHAYFRAFDQLKDRMVVFILVNVARLLRKMKFERN